MSLLGLISALGFLKVTLLLGGGPSGDLGHTFHVLPWEQFWLQALLWLLDQLLVLEQLLLQLRVWKRVHDLPLLLWLSFSMPLLRALVVSNALWQAPLRASSYDPCHFSLTCSSSLSSRSLAVVEFHTCAAGSSGRKVYLGLPFSLIDLHKREDPGLF